MEEYLPLISIIISVIAIVISIKALANLNDYLYEKRKGFDSENPDLCLVDEKNCDGCKADDKWGCLLNYKTKSKEIKGFEGLSVRRIPLEVCPKPKTDEKYIRLRMK